MLAAVSLTACKKNNAEEEIITPVTVDIPFVSDFSCEYYDASGNMIANRSTVFEPDDEIRVKFGFSLSSDAFAEGKRNFTLKFGLSNGFSGQITSANSSSTSDKDFTAIYSVDDRNAKQCEIEVRIKVRYSSGRLTVSYSYDEDVFSDALSLPLNNNKTLLYTYNTSADGYEVSKDPSNYKWLEKIKSLNLPDSFAGKPIVAIPKDAFNGCGDLISITIPDSVKSIGVGAFEGSSIETATLPSFAISRVPKAKLKSVTITSGYSIDDGALKDCGSLTSIVISDSVKSIGYEAFYGCGNLTSATIYGGVTSIDCYAFGNCSSLTDITIPDSVTSIKRNAFSGCSSLTSIVIPNGVGSIESYVFDGCSSLTSITVPESVGVIGNGAFGGCSSLTSIIIPSNVRSVAGDAFEGCFIETVTIPSFAISHIPTAKLKSVTINSGDSINDEALKGCSSLVSITIPDSVKSIGYQAFYGCSGLTSITIPDSVTSIGYSAFEGCSIETATIPSFAVSRIPKENLKTVTVTRGEISREAFKDYSNLTSVTIQKGVTSIEDYAFSGCSSLASVIISVGVKSIGSYAFSDCSSLASITIPDRVESN